MAGDISQRLKELGVPTLVMADGKVKSMDESLAGFMEFMDQEQLQQMGQ